GDGAGQHRGARRHHSAALRLSVSFAADPAWRGAAHLLPARRYIQMLAVSPHLRYGELPEKEQMVMCVRARLNGGACKSAGPRRNNSPDLPKLNTAAGIAGLKRN